MVVLNITRLLWNPFTYVTFHLNAHVKYVRVNLPPWQIPRDMFCSITLYILTVLNLLLKRHPQYVYAVRSNRVSLDNLPPPETPTIRLWYLHDVNSPYKYHHDCPGAGLWDSNTVKTYTSDDAMIEDLISLKEHFWCHNCERGLCFPNSCLLHGEDALVQGGDAEEEVEEEEEEIEE